MINGIVMFFKDIIVDYATFGTWFLTPIDFKVFTIAPLYIFSSGALVVLLGYFIIRSLTV